MRKIDTSKAHYVGLDQRIAPRSDVYVRLPFVMPDGRQEMCTCVNISADGMLMRFERGLEIGDLDAVEQLKNVNIPHLARLAREGYAIVTAIPSCTLMYKQELPLHKHDVQETVKQTIRQTGISIIYTSLVLVAGFIIFCLSDFGGTQALGWLTSLTLLVAMITNLVLLPVLLITTSKKMTIK